jgi:transcription factor C subunit 6
LLDMLPTHYLTIHQSAIRAIAWIRAPPSSGSGASLTAENPTVIASGGYDGVECLTDIRDLHGNVMNRTRGKHTPETQIRLSWFIEDA